MADKEKTDKVEKAPKKEHKPEKVEKVSRNPMEQDESETLVRILSYDIPGSRPIMVGLTYIKGISWTLANAICLKLNFPRNKRIVELTKPEIQKIEEFIRTMPLPDFLKNRRSDPETGETKHYFGTDLDMKKEFDIKRLKEIKSYIGIRHTSKQPVRGQRTRSHFRNKSQASGMKKAKKGAKA
ncbi:MAG: 30S ribosomal protein S13 [Nanoarchaeota archaeon]